MKIQKPDKKGKKPNHIAVIMDGNGRWAMAKNLPRKAGHRQGVEAARRFVNLAGKHGIKYVTLFGFSSENWRRPETEIQELMRLLRYYLRAETAELHKKNARLRVIGNRAAFEDDIVKLIENAETLTRNNTKINVTIALNYGGRHDILQATRKIAMQALEKGDLPDMAGLETMFENQLMTAELPPPDMLIRTSGEQRISNFMLWQCAYTELIFVPTLWPDFGEQDFLHALSEYAGRERRFGAVKTVLGSMK